MKTQFMPLATMTTLVVVSMATLVTVFVRSVVAPAETPSIDRNIFQIVPIEAPVPQQVVTGVVILPPGVAAPHHLHHGIESGYVLSGEVEIASDGESSRTYHRGETFVTHRDHPHVSRNPGTIEARALVTWVVDEDKPLSAPAS
jgi:quercetin dioxygenase-like cupin family protein